VGLLGIVLIGHLFLVGLADWLVFFFTAWFELYVDGWGHFTCLVPISSFKHFIVLALYFLTSLGFWNFKMGLIFLHSSNRKSMKNSSPIESYCKKSKQMSSE
jgi:hypothetical protein